jgi:hypothetical protein
MEPRSGDIQLVRDFYLILIALVFSYFLGVATTFNTLASPIVLFEWAMNILFHEGTSPSGEALFRSLGVTVIPLGSIMMYGIIWRYYEALLRSKEAKGRISLPWELLQVLILGLPPIGFLLFFSPSLALIRGGFSTGVVVEQYGGLVLSASILSITAYRTRKQWLTSGRSD